MARCAVDDVRKRRCTHRWCTHGQRQNARLTAAPAASLCFDTMIFLHFSGPVHLYDTHLRWEAFALHFRVARFSSFGLGYPA